MNQENIDFATLKLCKSAIRILKEVGTLERRIFEARSNQEKPLRHARKCQKPFLKGQ